MNPMSTRTLTSRWSTAQPEAVRHRNLRMEASRSRLRARVHLCLDASALAVNPPKKQFARVLPP